MDKGRHLGYCSLIGAKGSSFEGRQDNGEDNKESHLLVCNWQSEEESWIENANWHGECLNCPERLLRWDYADGSIAITNSDTDEKIEWEVSA